MTAVRRIAAAALVGALASGIAGLGASPASADTSWGGKVKNPQTYDTSWGGKTKMTSPQLTDTSWGGRVKASR